MPTVYLGLGANLGDREANVRRALELLAARGVGIRVASAMFETAPIGGPKGQPEFINAAAMAETDLSPRELLAAIMEVEKSLGRKRPAERWAARPIDIDILLYGERVIDAPDLTVPHPRIAERGFVLEPLAEIAPGLAVPGTGRTVAELWAAFNAPARRAGSGRRASPFRHIAVEGPMGVGKTTLAARLAHELGYRLVLEAPEANPFLPLMYKDRRRWAFQAQVSFLLDRYRQLSELAQGDLFAGGTVADYFFDKDRIFAGLNLSPEEFGLYRRLEEGVAGRLERPDAIVYLRASPGVLMERVRRRGIAYELGEDLPAYLERICAAYAEHFRSPAGAPVLVVDTDELDLVRGREQLAALVDALVGLGPGTSFFAPPGGGSPLAAMSAEGKK
ncbi:MAG TPA: 2-amino-4-hydroxy-6-hydroxymethyldihydropteridine diphosphokinase [Planctomycetota bacterium]|nr:2-amino-4-hydroxy-6-hydroxymethyldihydropteridine diphosphokinase [Planctomycetota bacterium]